MKKSAFIFFMAFLCGFFAWTEPLNLRLVISAGTLLEHHEPFYKSKIFVGEENPPFIIQKAGIAYVTPDVVIYSASQVSREEIVSAVDSKNFGIAHGFIGQSFRGFSIKEKASLDLIRYLSVESTKFRFEKRNINGKEIIAYYKSDKNNTWPKNKETLTTLPLVSIRESNGVEHIVAARLVGNLSNRLGIITSLLNEKPSGTAFIELGAEEGDGNVSLAKIEALTSLNPKAVFPGVVDMAMFSSGLAPTSLPYVYPFDDKYHRKVSINNEDINFWSVAGKEKFWPLYKKLGTVVNINKANAFMKALSVSPKKTLNIVKAFSLEAANAAAQSVYVDLVLLLSKDPFLSLSKKETIEFEPKLGNSRLAPIINLSYLDISEVRLTSINGNLKRIEVINHPITDEAPYALPENKNDMQLEKPGLPDLVHGWHKHDLEKVLGGIMLKASGADVAIFEALPTTTTIMGEIPLEMAKEMLSKKGNLATITISGKLLKKILKKVDVFSESLAFYGFDQKNAAIGKRTINDNEPYSLALSEGALLELFGISSLGGLDGEFAIRAPFIENIYGKIDDLNFIEGPKSISTADATLEIERALNHIRLDKSFDDIIFAFLSLNKPEDVKNFIEFSHGLPHTVITLDINYLDIGISKNATNDNYDGYIEDFPKGRGRTPSFIHYLIHAKASLNFDTPELLTSLKGEMKFLQLQKKKAEKDKIKIGLRFRLPWERTVFKDKAIVVSPIFETLYDTKLIAPRSKVLDSLLGVNVNFNRLRFNLDFGPAMSINFDRVNATNAFDFGPAMNFFSKWPLFGPLELSSEIKSYYLFPLPNNTAINKLAFGLEGKVWLRLVRFYDFSVSLANDLLLATFQEKPNKLAISYIFGFTISYGRLFRLLG